MSTTTLCECGHPVHENTCPNAFCMCYLRHKPSGELENSTWGGPYKPNELNSYPNLNIVTRRDYFAAAALQGILSNNFEWFGDAGLDEYTQYAAEIADDLLKKLDKK